MDRDVLRRGLVRVRRLAPARVSDRAVAPTIARVAYRRERALVAGRGPRNVLSQPSIVHYSINKSATQFVRRLLQATAKEEGLIPVHLNGLAFWSNGQYVDRIGVEGTPYEQAMVPYGYVYSVFGRPLPNFPNENAFRTLLVIRDPRDVLTSKYFSITRSHPLPPGERGERFLEHRRTNAALSIDAFALAEAEAMHNLLCQYSRLVDRVPTLLVLNYEDMVRDFSNWVYNLFTGLCLKADPVNVLAQFTERPIIPEHDRPNSKRRSVLPGDHKRKLKPETIEELDHRFREPLSNLGYVLP